MVRSLLASLAALVLLGACGGGSSSKQASPTPTPSSDPASTLAPASTVGCGPARPHPPGETAETMVSGGLTRAYDLLIPRTYDGSARTPVVLAFHPYGTAVRDFSAYTAFGAVASQNGAIVVTPAGSGDPPHWNTRKSPSDADDLGFVGDLLTKLDAELCIDHDRSDAVGYSDGGGMAQLLACEMSDRIAAVGTVAGIYSTCFGQTPVIAFHGTADPIAPFEGGDSASSAGTASFPNVRRVISEWAGSLGCGKLAIISRPDDEIELSTYRGCGGGDGEALLYTVIGGGHTWPGAAVALPGLGTTTQKVNASAEIWKFLAAHPLTER